MVVGCSVVVTLTGFLQVSIVPSAAEASAAAPPGGSVSVVVSEGLQLLLPLAGLFDVDKELKRLDKQKQKVRQGAAIWWVCASLTNSQPRARGGGGRVRGCSCCGHWRDCATWTRN